MRVLFYQKKFINILMDFQKTRTDEDIIEFLVGSGFEEDKVKKALKETRSKDFDTIIRYINTHINDPPKIDIKKTVNKEDEETESSDASEAKRIIEENRRKNLLERKYREELIKITREERRGCEEDETYELSQQSSSEEKAKEQADCIIKARIPNGEEKMIYLSKNQTVKDVFDKISEIAGITNFKLYKINYPNAIESSDEKLENFKLLYPRSTVFIEEE